MALSAPVQGILGPNHRALSDHAHGWLNVRSFGAKDRTEAASFDSRAAIQDAIDTAFAGGGGAVVIAGKYNIGAPGLVVRQAVTLYNFAGQAERSNTNNRSAAGLYALGSAPFDMVTIVGAQAGLKGVSVFDGPRDGIVVSAQAATIEGCAVIHSKGNGVVLGSGTTLIFNTHVIGPGKSGITVNANDNRIISSEVQQPNSADGGSSEPLNTYDCVTVNAVGALQIMNCRMGDDLYRSRDGIRVTNGGNIQITNCDLQNCAEVGVNLLGGNTFAIAGCNIASASISAAKAGIHLGTGNFAVKHVAIAGNTLNGIVQGGVGGISVDAGVTGWAAAGNSFFGNWSGAYAVVGDTTGGVFAQNAGLV